MTYHWIGILTLAGNGVVMATPGECFVSDDFSSWSGTWTFHETSASSLQLTHTNNRASANCYGHNDVLPAFAWAAPDNWKIDMTADWALSADWNVDPITPTSGDTGMAFILLLEGDPHSVDLQKAWTLSAGTYNAADGYSEYDSSNLWVDNYYTREEIDFERNVQGTVYVWWDASEQRIWANTDVFSTVDAFTSSLSGFSSATDAWIGFGAFAFGSVPASTDRMWADNFCIFEGNAVGTVVGACCMDGMCVQIPESACMGTFSGVGTYCDDCQCAPQSGCGGDVNADDEVGHADLLAVVDRWGQSLDCGTDPDGGTSLGVEDLLILLANWGPCDHA